MKGITGPFHAARAHVASSSTSPFFAAALQPPTARRCRSLSVFLLLSPSFPSFGTTENTTTTTTSKLRVSLSLSLSLSLFRNSRVESLISCSVVLYALPRASIEISREDEGKRERSEPSTLRALSRSRWKSSLSLLDFPGISIFTVRFFSDPSAGVIRRGGLKRETCGSRE